jgi:hypothetical protein
MLRTASTYRLFAAAIALLMLASVALPSVAHACAAVKATVAATAPCCPAGGSGTPAPMPCHGEAPAGGAAEAACCTASALFTAHEAALTKQSAVPAVSCAPLAPDHCPSSGEAFQPLAPVHLAAPASGGPGLHVLYGALLN